MELNDLKKEINEVIQQIDDKDFIEKIYVIIKNKKNEKK